MMTCKHSLSRWLTSCLDAFPLRCCGRTCWNWNIFWPSIWRWQRKSQSHFPSWWGCLSSEIVGSKCRKRSGVYHVRRQKCVTYEMTQLGCQGLRKYFYACGIWQLLREVACIMWGDKRNCLTWLCDIVTPGIPTVTVTFVTDTHVVWLSHPLCPHHSSFLVLLFVWAKRSAAQTLWLLHFKSRGPCKLSCSWSLCCFDTFN